MIEFNQVEYDRLMSEGVVLHNQQRYDEALTRSRLAYEMAPDGSTQQAAAARDNGARYYRLNNFSYALRWLQEAFDTHDQIVKKSPDPTREDYRQRAVSAMHLSVSGLHEAIRLRAMRGDINTVDDLNLMRLVAQDLKQARLRATSVNRWIDQYDTLAARRISVAESLFGKRAKGVGYAVKQILLAAMSESLSLDTSSVNMPKEVRKQTKVKALKGGLAALSISALTFLYGSRARSLGMSLAEKIL
ncbi:MAG: hypothetical protein ACYCPS_03990 [Candidatus Saccharimonadales bacterium]